jgi:mannose-1-phosphate guanylyltransferase
MLQAQAPKIPDGNYLPEPGPKGTASVIGLAAAFLEAQHAGSVMAVLTADHIIQSEERFRGLLSAGYQAAAEGRLVTLGISPTLPSTSYGYIQMGQRVGSYRGFKVHASLGFREKPSREQAEEFLAQGNYVWNSGMFVWRARRILDEIQRYLPALHRVLAEFTGAIGEPGARDVLKEAWSTLESETIDYGVMEKAEDVVVIPAGELGWYDIGTWDRLFDLGDLDDQGNLIMAQETLSLNTEDTLIFQRDQELEPALIAVLGVRDLIIIDTGDVVLICDRKKAEQVRELVERLGDRGKEKYL